MLEVLRSIVQEVSAARDLDQALAVTVQRVKAALEVDVCSVYMMDRESDELVLMASEGLKAEAIGRVRLRFEEGLVGLVAQRAEPVNLDEAPDHPRYRYFPETGEERYHAFLGVPIIHHRMILGVLVVQQYRAHRYDEDTVTLLVTIAAQLAGAIAHAEASGGIDALRRSSGADEGRPLNGLPGSPGIGIGVAMVIRPYGDIEGVPDRAVTDIEAELGRLRQAIDAVKQEVRLMVANMVDVLPASEVALFDAYLLMLDSDSFLGDIREGIRQGNWAPGALREVISAHVRVFREMEDPYLRERAEDVRDLGQRILRQLDDQPKRDINYPANTILVGDEITASVLAEAPLNRLAGIVAAQGSNTSHAAILARALGVPAILGVEDLPVLRMDGLNMVIDGYAGRIYINPPADIKREYQRLQQEERELSKDLQELRDLEAVTPDGEQVALYANTGLMSDVTPSLNSGAKGVGLYRTEFPFLIRERFPGEEEQYQVYRHVLEAFAPNPVTMRTLDVGGDKQLPYFPIEEDNPFLGWRGIRVTLDHPEIMLTQVRAMLRADVGLGNLRLLLPMISALSEVDEALTLIQRAHSGLLEEGVPVELPPIGVMVEVPSVVFQIDSLAKRVDFLSIGSNDLTQYMLSVDRNNARVAELYDSLHPAMLRVLRLIVKEAQRNQLPVSVCGEMAGDPMAALVLIGLGVDSLSMSASSVPRIKWVVRSFSKRSAKGIVTKVMKLQDPLTIRAYLRKRLEGAGLGGLVRGGK
jgi:phosphotransferase system enzyme I (PtsP)